MATFSKQIFNPSGSFILVAGTSTSNSTQVHTVPAGSVKDEIWIYATNNDASSVNLTLEFPSGSTGNNIKQAIPATSGLTVIVPGLILTSSQTVSAFAGSASKITLHGYVNRIS